MVETDYKEEDVARLLTFTPAVRMPNWLQSSLSSFRDLDSRLPLIVHTRSWTRQALKESYSDVNVLRFLWKYSMRREENCRTEAGSIDDDVQETVRKTTLISRKEQRVKKKIYRFLRISVHRLTASSVGQQKTPELPRQCSNKEAFLTSTDRNCKPSVL